MEKDDGERAPDGRAEATLEGVDSSPITAASEVLRVGDVELDPERFEARRGDLRLPFEPRVFDFVLYLAQNDDRVVSRGELVRTVWRGCRVSDAAIDRCAYLARKLLGDPKPIVTVPRRGYRWAGDASR